MVEKKIQWSSTGEPDAESQQELCSHLDRDAPAPAALAAVRARWAITRRAAAVAFANVQGGDAIPTHNPSGEVGKSPHSAGMFIAR